MQVACHPKPQNGWPDIPNSGKKPNGRGMRRFGERKKGQGNGMHGGRIRPTDVQLGAHIIPPPGDPFFLTLHLFSTSSLRIASRIGVRFGLGGVTRARDTDDAVGTSGVLAFPSVCLGTGAFWAVGLRLATTHLGLPPACNVYTVFHVSWRWGEGGSSADSIGCPGSVVHATDGMFGRAHLVAAACRLGCLLLRGAATAR